MKEEVDLIANQIAKRTGSDLDFPRGLMKTGQTVEKVLLSDYDKIANYFKVGIVTASAFAVVTTMHHQSLVGFNLLFDDPINSTLLEFLAIAPMIGALGGLLDLNSSMRDMKLSTLIRSLFTPSSHLYSQDVGAIEIRKPRIWNAFNLLRIFRKTKLSERLRYDVDNDEYRLITYHGSYYRITKTESIFLGERGIFAKARQEIGNIK